MHLMKTTLERIKKQTKQTTCKTKIDEEVGISEGIANRTKKSSPTDRRLSLGRMFQNFGAMNEKVVS